MGLPSLYLLLSVAGFATVHAAPPPCAPGTLATNAVLARAHAQNERENAGAPRGESKDVIEQVARSPELARYLKENRGPDDFDKNNIEYIGLLPPNERAGLIDAHGLPIQKRLPSPEGRAPQPAVKIMYSPLNPARPLNNTYFDGHLEWTDAARDHYKRIFNEVLNHELEQSPDLKALYLTNYNDYKAIAVAFKEVKDPQMQQRLARLMDHTTNIVGYRFAAEYGRGPLARLTQNQRPHIAHPELWFTPGVGPSHQRAALASRYARKLNPPGAGRLKVADWNDPAIQAALQRDLDDLHHASRELATFFPKPNAIVEYGANRAERALTLEMSILLRGIKTSQVETAAGENFREALRRPFPKLSLTDSQIRELREVLARPESLRPTRGLPPDFAPANELKKMVEQGFLVRSKDKKPIYTLSSDTLQALQNERDINHYETTVRKAVEEQFGITLSKPQILKIRQLATMADDFSSAVLQAQHSPLEGLVSPYGGFGVDIKGQGARNIYFTLGNLLRAANPEEAVDFANQAFRKADAPLIEARTKSDRAFHAAFGRPPVQQGVSGDEIVIPFFSATDVPNRMQVDRYFLDLVTSSEYKPSDIRFAVGKRLKEAQDLEKELRVALRPHRKVAAEFDRYSIGVEVEELPDGRFTAHLLLSGKPSAAGRAALADALTNVIAHQKGNARFERGEIRVAGEPFAQKHSKPGKRAELSPGRILSMQTIDKDSWLHYSRP